jgi:ribulose-phosphate 3-epimerase
LVEELLPFVDLVLVMTVNPGYGGQSMIFETLEKVRRLTEIRDKGNGDFLISVDGGINRHTASRAIEAGIDVAVAGSAFFGSENPAEEIDILKGKVEGSR